MKRKQSVIAITGASGFLGNVLVDHFLSKGWRVIALVRDSRDKSRKHPNLEYRSYDITQPVDPKGLSGVTYLVHAAYIKFDPSNPDALESNVTGANNLIEAALKAGVSRLTFISTMSAHKDAISVYGRQKLAIESLFLKQKNAVVLRCGLIIGDGGIVKEMTKFMKSKHAVPLIGGGMQPLQIIGVQDLAQSIENVFLKSLTGRYVVAHPKVYSYKSFYAALSKHTHTKVIYIPVPYRALEIAFKAASRIGIPLGVGEDNLKGLKKLVQMPSEADMKEIGVSPATLEGALKASKL